MQLSCLCSGSNNKLLLLIPCLMSYLNVEQRPLSICHEAFDQLLKHCISLAKMYYLLLALWSSSFHYTVNIYEFNILNLLNSYVGSWPYRLHSDDTLLHLGDISYVIFIRTELSLLNTLVNAHHHVPRDVRSIVHPCTDIHTFEGHSWWKMQQLSKSKNFKGNHITINKFG